VRPDDFCLDGYRGQAVGVAHPFGVGLRTPTSQGTCPAPHRVQRLMALQGGWPQEAGPQESAEHCSIIPQEADQPHPAQTHSSGHLGVGVVPSASGTRPWFRPGPLRHPQPLPSPETLVTPPRCKMTSGARLQGLKPREWPRAGTSADAPGISTTLGCGLERDGGVWTDGFSNLRLGPQEDHRCPR
jgi:hypothetical protein